ncbi:hypothetical protein Tco_0109709 [Tanacetum coccineum]
MLTVSGRTKTRGIANDWVSSGNFLMLDGMMISDVDDEALVQQVASEQRYLKDGDGMAFPFLRCQVIPECQDTTYTCYIVMKTSSSVKASANSDVMYFFTSAQDGDPSQDDVRLCLGDDLKKAQDHS